MSKLLLMVVLVFNSTFSWGQLPTPEELEEVSADDEYASSEKLIIDTKDVLRNGVSTVCVIESANTDKQMSLQSACSDVIESIRQDFCIKWPKSSYAIIQKRCQLEDWKLIRGTCTSLKNYGVGFCHCKKIKSLDYE